MHFDEQQLNSQNPRKFVIIQLILMKPQYMSFEYVCIYTCVFCSTVGESDGYSITSSLSRRSSSARSRAKSASATRPVTAVRQVATPSDDEVRPRTLRPATAVPAKPAVRPPLTQSLFPNIPPTIHFETEGFKSKCKQICKKNVGVVLLIQ